MENMDSGGLGEPLLEAKLELREPDLYYVPSLEPDDPDGLDQLILHLLNDIIGMAALLPRLKEDSAGYAVELEEDADIKGMKNEILNNVTTAVEEATEFCSNFEGGPDITRVSAPRKFLFPLTAPLRPDVYAPR